MKHLTILIISLQLFVTVTYATTINVPSHYSSIQVDIDTKANCDTVFVQPIPLKVDPYDSPEWTIPTDEVPGDSLPRIQVPQGYQAFVHAVGLSGADGLAMSPDGVLYVAEEYANRVSAIAEDGTVTHFATGISYPEGIAFDQAGNLYVVEDVQNGRLLQFDPDGIFTVLATGRDAPEGVAIEADGNIILTESNVEFTSNPFNYRTRVTRVTPGSGPEILHLAMWLWSYSGIAIDSDGLIYICNEASGTGTNHSVFTVRPETGLRSLFCSGLIACEGLCFQPGGGFPLFVVEEDLGGGEGRISTIDALGSATPFATGFYNIEDVLIDDFGRIFVSEDGTGMIIRIVGMTPNVGVELIPYGTPIQIPASGGSFSYSATVTNNTDDTQTFYAVLFADIPNGNQYGPISPTPYLVQLPADASVDVDLTQNVPGNAPAGVYTYYCLVGTDFNSIIDSSGFTFTKLGTAQSGGIREWISYYRDGGVEMRGNDMWAVDGIYREDGTLITGSMAVDERSLAVSFALYQNYPNPFNPVTTIRYELPEPSYVTIMIYDILGREVRKLVSGELVSGYHKAVWDGTDSFGKSVSAGVYLYQIQASGFTQTRKMLILK